LLITCALLEITGMPTRTRSAIAEERAGTPRLTSAGYAFLVLAMWLAMVAVDLVFNAGLFSAIFFRPGPFLLAPRTLFARIPVGYLSFLMLAILLLWLMVRLGVKGSRAGWRCGVVAGALTGGAFLAGLYSVSTAEVSLLFAWFTTGTVQMGAAGGIAGLGLDRARPRWLLVAASGGLIAAILIIATMQTLGLAVAIRK
jgi:hypothetical protein